MFWMENGGTGSEEWCTGGKVQVLSLVYWCRGTGRTPGVRSYIPRRPLACSPPNVDGDSIGANTEPVPTMDLGAQTAWGLWWALGGKPGTKCATT